MTLLLNMLKKTAARAKKVAMEKIMMKTMGTRILAAARKTMTRTAAKEKTAAILNKFSLRA